MDMVRKKSKASEIEKKEDYSHLGLAKKRVSIRSDWTGAAAAAARIFTRLISKVIVNKLARAKCRAQVAGSRVVGGGSRSKGRIIMVVVIVAFVHRPIESVTKIFLGPSLGITQQQSDGTFLFTLNDTHFFLKFPSPFHNWQLVQICT